MSLRKILPVIIVLITISLIGIIYIQYNRLQNLAIVRQEQIYEKVSLAVQKVGEEISYGMSGAPTLRNRHKTTLGLGSDIAPIGMLRPPLVEDRFTLFEIQEKLNKAFSEVKLPVQNYELALTNNLDLFEIEMMTPGYEKAFEQVEKDSINHAMWILPIDPPTDNWTEGMAPYETLWVIIPDFKNLTLKQSFNDFLGAIIFTLFIMFAFFITVRTMLNQKKLSEIKSDFINNMTHEFKTPLATIALAVDALNNEKVLQNEEKLNYFRGIIKEENKRMNKHVETILQAAALEKQEFSLNKTKLHGHQLIQKAVQNYELVLAEKNGKITSNFNARHDTIVVDETHFGNMLNNLLDNAIKYSDKEPVITITTHSSARHFVIRIADEGIGMSRETVKKIFEKFYRAHTGNLHNVKGFGLGMSYVKTIVDAHKGKIRVDSTLGKGSSFTIELPLAV